MGLFLHTPESARTLSGDCFAPGYNYHDYEGGDAGISAYASFNAWWSRCFKEIDRQRPVAQAR